MTPGKHLSIRHVGSRHRALQRSRKITNQNNLLWFDYVFSHFAHTAAGQCDQGMSHEFSNQLLVRLAIGRNVRRGREMKTCNLRRSSAIHCAIFKMKITQSCSVYAGRTSPCTHEAMVAATRFSSDPPLQSNRRDLGKQLSTCLSIGKVADLTFYCYLGG